MKYNILGKTDLRVSRLCLGCMTFGEPNRGNHAWTLPEESSRTPLRAALTFSIPPTATPLAVAKRLSVARCVISPAAKMSWSLPRFFTRLMI